MRQIALGQIRNPLEVVVAGIAEVSGAEAEKDRDRAAIPALILQVIGAVFGAHLQERRNE